jgi:hypothetical protein
MGPVQDWLADWRKFIRGSLHQKLSCGSRRYRGRASWGDTKTASELSKCIVRVTVALYTLERNDNKSYLS